MSFPDLRSFIERLRSDNDIVTVDAPVDAHLEVAEIHRRVIAAGGPALLFTNVTGKDFRLVTNLFGTAKRAEMAFGERPLRLVRRLVDLAETILPPTPSALWGARDVGLELVKIGMRKVPTGPVIDRVTSNVQLDRLPALTCWPEDGGPFMTLPLVYTQHPDRRGHNLGMYRMQVHGPRMAGMHWQIGKGGGYHYAVSEARGQRLPATVFLGGPPALVLSAIAPLPENIPELVLASLIAGERLPRVHGHGPHPLIANAEFALRATDHDPAVARFAVGALPTQRVIPILECVTRLGPGSWLARFGYDNPNHLPVTRQVGAENAFLPAPIDRGQPVRFEPGRQRDVFETSFRGGRLAWRLDGRFEVASTLSPRCP